jgi:hypothetical protein
MLEGPGGRDVYVIIAVTSVDVNIPSVPRRPSPGDDRPQETTKFRAEIQTRTHHVTAAGKIHDQRSRSDRPGADGGYEEAKAEVAERPGYNRLGDPRAVETEHEGTQWNR